MIDHNLEQQEACHNMLREIKTLEQAYEDFMQEYDTLFYPQIMKKIIDFIHKTQKNMNITTQSQGESQKALRMIRKWVTNQNHITTKNFKELRTYIQEQDKNENNKDYFPPSPKHRDPAQQIIKIHQDWNKKTSSIIQ